MNKRLKVDQYDEPKVFAYLVDKGLYPDKANLQALRLAANVAKHSGGRSAKQLYKLRPDLFDAANIKATGSPTYADFLIADAVVESFFEAVRKSGPYARS